MGENSYHAECFKCSVCAMALSGKPYVLHDDGKFYCEADYAVAIRPKCAHCEETILDDYITAMDRDWHEDHFLCSDCGEGFPEGRFHVFDDHPYCSPCYDKKIAMSCGNCGKAIQEQDMYEAVGNKYHLECFVCQTGLHKIADGESFALFADKIYCPKHFMEKLQTLCSVCKKPIVGELLSVGGAQLHPACWKCRVCQSALSPQTAIVEDLGLFVCSTCAADGSSSHGAGSQGTTALLPGHKALDQATPEEVGNWLKTLGLSEDSRLGLSGVDGATLASAPPKELQEPLRLEPSAFQTFEKQLQDAKDHGIPLVGYVPLDKASADDVARWAESIGLPPSALSGIDGASLVGASPEELNSQMRLTPDQQRQFDRDLITAKRDGIPGFVSSPERPDSNIPLEEATAPEVARWAKSIGVPAASRFLLAGMDGAELERIPSGELIKQLALDSAAAKNFGEELATIKMVGLPYQGDVPLEHATAAEVARWADDVGLPDHPRSQLAGADGATLASVSPNELRSLLGLEPAPFSKFSQSLDAAKRAGILTWEDAPASSSNGVAFKPLSEASGPEIARWANSIGLPASARLPLAGMSGATLANTPSNKTINELNLDLLPAKSFEKQLEQAKLAGIPITEIKPLVDATPLEVARWLDDSGLPAVSRAQLAGVSGNVLISTSANDLQDLQLDPQTRQAFEKSLDAAKNSGIPGKRASTGNAVGANGTAGAASEAAGAAGTRPNFRPLAEAIPAEILRWANAVGIPNIARLQLAGQGTDGASLSKILPEDFAKQLKLDPLTAKQVEKSLTIAQKIGFPTPNVKPLSAATPSEVTRWVDDLGLDEGLLGVDGVTLVDASFEELKFQLKLEPTAEPQFKKGLESAKATGILANFKAAGALNQVDPAAEGITPIAKANAAEVAHWAKQIGIPAASRARLAGMDGAELSRASLQDLAKQLHLDALPLKNLEKQLESVRKNGLPALAMKPLADASPREVASWAEDVGLTNNALSGADGDILTKASSAELESLNLSSDTFKNFEKNLEAAKICGIPAVPDKRFQAKVKPLAELSGPETARWTNEIGVPASSRLRLEGRDGATVAKDSSDHLKKELHLPALAAKSFEKNLERAKKHGVSCESAGVTPLFYATSSEVAHWVDNIGLSEKGRVMMGLDGATLATASLEELKSQLKQLDAREFQSFYSSLDAAKKSGIPGDGLDDEDLDDDDGAVGLKPLAAATAAEVAHWAKSVGVPPAARLQLAGMDGGTLAHASADQIRAQLALEPRQMATFLQNLGAAKTIGLIVSGTKPLSEGTGAEIRNWADDIGLADQGRALAGVDGVILASTAPEELKMQLNLNPQQWQNFVQSLEAAKDSGIVSANSSRSSSPAAGGKLDPQALERASGPVIARWMSDIGVPTAARARLGGMTGADLAKMSSTTLKDTLRLNPFSLRGFEKHLAVAKKSGLPPIPTKPFVDANAREVARWGNDIGLPDDILAGVDGQTLIRASPNEMKTLALEAEARGNFDKSFEAAKKSGIPVVPGRFDEGWMAFKPMILITPPQVAQWTKDIGIPAAARSKLAGMDGAALANATPEELMQQMELSPLAKKSFESSLEAAKSNGVPVSGSKPLMYANQEEVADWANDGGFDSPGENGLVLSTSPDIVQSLNMSPEDRANFEKSLDAAKKTGIPVQADGTKPFTEATAAEIARWAHDTGVPGASRLNLAGVDGLALVDMPAQNVKKQLGLDSEQAKKFDKSLEAAKVHGLPFVASKPFVTASASDVARWADDVGLSDKDLACLQGADGATLASAALEELKGQLSLSPAQWTAFEKSFDAAKRDGIPGDGKGPKPVPLAKSSAAEVARWANVVGVPAAARLKLAGVDGAALSSLSSKQLSLEGPAAKSFDENLATAKKVGLPPTSTKPLSEASAAEIAQWSEDIGLPAQARSPLVGVDGLQLASASSDNLHDELKLGAQEQKSFDKSLEASKKSGIVGIPALAPGRKALSDATPAEIAAWAESIGLPANVRSQLIGADGDALSRAEPEDVQFASPEDRAKFEKNLAAAKLHGVAGSAKAATAAAPAAARGWLKPLGEASSVEVARWANDHDMIPSARAQLACLDGATLEKTPIDVLSALLKLDPLPMKTFEKQLAAAKKSGLPPLTVKPLVDASPAEVSRWADDIGLPQHPSLQGIDGAVLAQSSAADRQEFKLDLLSQKSFDKCFEAAKTVGIPGGSARPSTGALRPLAEASAADVAQWVNDIGVPSQARTHLAVEGPELAQLTVSPKLGLTSLQAKSFEKQLDLAKRDGIPPGRLAPPERRPPPAAPVRKPGTPTNANAKPGFKPLAEANAAEIARWAKDLPEYARSQLGDGAKLSKASQNDLQQSLKLGPLAYKSFEHNLEAAKRDGIPITTDTVRMKPLTQANTADIARWLNSAGVPASSRLLLAGANGSALAQTSPEKLAAQMQLGPIPTKTFVKNLESAKKEGVRAIETKPLASANVAEMLHWADDIGLPLDARSGLKDGISATQIRLDPPAQAWLDAAKKDGVPILTDEQSVEAGGLRSGYKPLSDASAAEVNKWASGLGLTECVRGIDGASLSRLPFGQLREFVGEDASPVKWQRFEVALATAKKEGIPAGKVTSGGSFGSRTLKPLEQASSAEIADWSRDIGGLPNALQGLDGAAIKDYDVKSLDLEPARKTSFIKKLEAAKQYGIPFSISDQVSTLKPGYKPLAEASSNEVSQWLRDVGLPSLTLEIDGANLAKLTPEKMQGLGLGALQIRSLQRSVDNAKREGVPIVTGVRAARPSKPAPPPSPSPRGDRVAQPVRKPPTTPGSKEEKKSGFSFGKGNKPLADATAAEVATWLRDIGLPESARLQLAGVNGAALSSMSPERFKQFGLAPLPLRSFEKNLAIVKCEGIPTEKASREPKLRISRGEAIQSVPAGKVSKHFKDASSEEVRRWATSVGLPEAALQHLQGLDGSKLAVMSRADLGKMLGLQPLQWRSFEKHLDLAQSEGLMWTARLRPVGNGARRPSGQGGVNVNLRHVDLGPNSGILKRLPELNNKELFQWMKMLQLPNRAVDVLLTKYETGEKLYAAPIDEVKRLVNLRPLPWQTLEKHLGGAAKNGLVFPYHGGRVFPAPDPDQVDSLKPRQAERKQDSKNGDKQGGSSAPAAAAFKFYTYSALRDPIANVPKDVNLASREMHLVDDEFVKIFGMDKTAFAKLPVWKKNDKKKALKLF